MKDGLRKINEGYHLFILITYNKERTLILHLIALIFVVNDFTLSEKSSEPQRKSILIKIVISDSNNRSLDIAVLPKSERH